MLWQWIEMRAGAYWRVTCGGLFGTCTNSILGCSTVAVRSPGSRPSFLCAL